MGVDGTTEIHSFGVLGRRVPSLMPQQLVELDDGVIAECYLIPHYHLHLMPTQAVVCPPEGKQYWDTPGIEEEYRQYREGVSLSPTAKYPVRLALSQLQFVNDVGRDFYCFANGKLTGKEIYANVLRKNKAPDGTLQETCYNFLRKMISQRHLSVSDVPSEKGYTISGSEDYFIPVHAALEVTAQCNARCKHCYGSFSVARKHVMETNDVIRLLDELRNSGVRAIELTGGECTMHPDFSAIFDKCVETFDLVAVLTNGITVPDKVFEIARLHPWNLSVQICINGKKEYHDDFVAVKGAFDLATNSIRRFSECGVMTRAAMNITLENWKDMEYVCVHVAESGASQFSASWVDASQGRAASFLNKCTTHVERCPIIEASQAMLSLAEKYPGFAIFSLAQTTQKMQAYDKSCGVGRRSIYITSDGVVHICPMSIGTNIPGFGTVQSYIRSQKPWDNAFSRLIQHVNEPNDTDCGDCDKRRECTCIARGMRQYMKITEACAWGKRYQLNQLLENADWTGVETS